MLPVVDASSRYPRTTEFKPLRGAPGFCVPPCLCGPGQQGPRWLLVAGPPLAERVGVRLAQSSSEDRVTVHFVSRASETLTAKGKVGDSLLDVVRENNLDTDGSGACEGTLACSTCHLICREHILEKSEAVTDEEDGMLDLARKINRSRLGQIYLTKAMNRTVGVPDAVADA